MYFKVYQKKEVSLDKIKNRKIIEFNNSFLNYFFIDDNLKYLKNNNHFYDKNYFILLNDNKIEIIIKKDEKYYLCILRELKKEIELLIESMNKIKFILELKIGVI